MDLFEPERPYIVKAKGVLTSKGREEIEELLRSNYRVNPHLDLFGGFELVNHQGKITKRIRKNVYNMRGIDLSNSDVSEIGNIANNNTLEEGVYVFRISRDMDIWDQHDSLTTNSDTMNLSCFRPGASYHHNWIAMNRHPDFYAVRVSMEEDSDTLVARCWAMFREREQELLYLFNSYGLRLDEMTALICEGLDASAAIAEVRSEDIYVNSHSVRVIGKDVSPSNYYPVGIIANTRNSLRTCRECGNAFDLEDEGIEYGDSNYCTDCCSSCGRCSSFVPAITMEVGLLDDSINLCHSCYHNERQRHTCRSCGSFHRDHDELRRVPGSIGYWCDDCISPCADCGDMFATSSLTGSDVPGRTDTLCHDCHRSERSRHTCHACHTTYRHDNTNEEIFPINNFGRIICHQCAIYCASCSQGMSHRRAYRNVLSGETNLCYDCSEDVQNISHYMRITPSRIGTSRRTSIAVFLFNKARSNSYYEDIIRNMAEDRPDVVQEYVHTMATSPYATPHQPTGVESWLDAVYFSFKHMRDVMREETDEENTDEVLVSRVNVMHSNLAQMIGDIGTWETGSHEESVMAADYAHSLIREFYFGSSQGDD